MRARIEGVKRFFKSSFVGIVATIVDLSLLLLLQNSLHLHEYVAKTFALAAGVSTQFFGNRLFAFNAGAGRVDRQLKWFLLVETVAFVATVMVYGWLFHRLSELATRAHPPGKLLGFLAPEIAANLLSGFIVYFGFSYPLWKRVFKLTPEELAAQAQKSVTTKTDQEAS
jgi:putative flippase GtrA